VELGVFYKIQNTKCQLLWNDGMQNTEIFRVIFSSIQMKASLGSFVLSFFCLLRPKSKIENNHLFAKKICIVV
jgi:hypothetical protein